MVKPVRGPSGGVWLIVAIIILGFGVQCGYLYGTRSTIVAKVRKTEVKRQDRGKKSKDVYLVYTDKGVFRNEDSWAVFKCNSSDVYNQLEVGKCYKMTVYGFRIHCNSSYKNIVKVKPATCP